MFSRRLRAPFAMLALTASIAAFAADEGTHAITIYSTMTPGSISPDQYRNGGAGHSLPGYATVRHEREIALNTGRNTIRFTDVAGLIDPTTVSFSSLTDPAGTRVMEQNFQFDLVSPEKLLARFIDRDIAVERMVGNQIETLEGKLLSTQGGMVIREADGSVRTLPYNAGVKLPSLPGGLITRPTLVWDVIAGKAGNAQDARCLSNHRHYLVGGLQPDLCRRQGCQLLQGGHRRLGQHPQSIGWQLSRRENKTGRRRRASGRAYRRRRCRWRQRR